jgi:hypothetical protein
MVIAKPEKLNEDFAKEVRNEKFRCPRVFRVKPLPFRLYAKRLFYSHVHEGSFCVYVWRQMTLKQISGFWRVTQK